MTLEYFLSLLFAGGLGGVIVAVSEALKKRRDANRDDRKQKVDESSAIAVNAKTIADAAGNVVKLHDDQAGELRQEISALRAELADERKRATSDRDDLIRRIVDTESRLARSERRAGESEKQAHEFRQDVIRLGERLARERTEYQNNINKLVVIIEAMFNRMKTAGLEPEVDLEALKRLYVIVERPTA